MEFNHKLHTGYILGINKTPKCYHNNGSWSSCTYCFLCKKATKIQSNLYQSAADVTHASKTPIWIEKYADLFLVQWEEMKTIFPNAICCGVL